MRLLITADWHLRADRPRCRTDEDWIQTQENILKQIADYANNYKVPVCIIGDLFNTPQVPARIMSMFLRFCNSMIMPVFLLAGNHCLPYHSWQNVSSSSFGELHELMEDGRYNLLKLSVLGLWAHFNEEFTGNPDTGLRFIHRLVFPSVKDLPPSEKACTAAELLAEFPDSKWIFTGDMHTAFHFEHKGKHVVNPGCINRQHADYKEYKPSVYLVDTEEETVEQLWLDDPAELVTDSYLQVEEERENRISAFVETVRGVGEISLDFVGNVARARQKTELDADTSRMIDELMEVKG